MMGRIQQTQQQIIQRRSAATGRKDPRTGARMEDATDGEGVPLAMQERPSLDTTPSSQATQAASATLKYMELEHGLQLLLEMMVPTQGTQELLREAKK